MRTLRTLKPGQKGTGDLVTQHGASLVCVRYRYDEDTREHLKTVELIVQRRSRAASRAASPASGSLARGAESDGPRKPGGSAAVAATRKVALRIGLRERGLQRRVKSAGGRWDPDRRVWYVRRDAAERLGLLGRVVGGPI